MPTATDDKASVPKVDASSTVDTSPVNNQSVQWLYPTDVSDSLRQEWTTDRVERARGLLSASIKPSGPLPQSEEETQYKLDTWWKDAGQYMPSHVLDELGIIGGNRVPTKLSDLREDDKEAAKNLKRFLGIKIEGDPLQAFMKTEGEKPENFDPFNLELPPEAIDILKSASDEDLDKIFSVMNKNFMDFPTNVVTAAIEERDIRDEVKKILPTIEANPIEIFRGSQFLDVWSLGLTRSIGTKENKLTLKAIGRIRQGLYEENPTILNALSLNAGGIAAELMKFMMLPDPAKLAVFARLSKATKAAIGVGFKSGLLALLNAPKEGETIEDRAKEVATATGIGAVTGATLSKLFDGAKAIFGKIKDLPVAKQAETILFNNPNLGMTKEEVVSVLKHLKSTDPVQFKASIEYVPRKSVASQVVPNRAALPAGFRPGFADIEKPSQAISKAVAAAADKNLAAGVAVEAAKALTSKAAPVKPTQPLKIVSPKEAGPFKVEYSAGQVGGATKLMADPEGRKALQVAENKVAKLRTRLEQTKADSKVDKARGITIEKAKANEKLAKQLEIDLNKKIEAVDAEKLRGAVKLVDTRVKAANILNKWKASTEFKADMRKEAVSMVMAIPKNLRADFIVRASKAESITTIHHLGDEIQAGIEKWEKRSAVKDLSKFISDIESKNKLGVQRLGKIPPPQREQIAKLIDSVDLKKLTSKKEEDLLSLQEHMNRIASELAGNYEALGTETMQAVMLPEARKAELLRLSQIKVADITADDVRTIHDELANLVTQAKTKSSLLIGDSLKPIKDIKDPIVSNIAPTRAATRKQAKVAGGQPEAGLTDAEKRKAAIKKSLQTSERNLESIVQFSTKTQDGPLEDIFVHDLHKGQRESSEYLVHWLKQSTERFKKIGFTDIKQIKDMNSVTLAGRKVTLSTAKLIKLELMSRYGLALKDIEDTKGFDIDGKFFYYPITMTREQRLIELSEALKTVRSNPMYKGVADWVNELGSQRRDAIDQVFMKLEGHPKTFNDPMYTSVPRSLPESAGATRVGQIVPTEYSGSYLPKTGGSAPIKLQDVDVDFLSGLETDSALQSAISMRNARIILVSQWFQDEMKLAGRDVELSEMKELFKRIQGSTTSKGLAEILGSKISANITYAVLGYRVASAGSAVMSFPMYYNEFGFGGVFAKGFKPLGKGYLNSLREDSAITDLRWMGRRVNIDTASAVAPETFNLLFFNKHSKLGPKGLDWLTWGDSQALGNGHRLAVRDVLITPRNGKNVKPEDWNGKYSADLIPMTDDLAGPQGYPTNPDVRMAAARRFEYATRRGQPMGGQLDSSTSQTTPNIFVRVIANKFRSAVNAQDQALARAEDEFFKSGKTKEDYAKLIQSGAAVGASIAAYTAWKMSWKAARKAGAKKIKKEALGIFSYTEEKESDDIAKEFGVDLLENYIQTRTRFGKFFVLAGEQLINTITGDGYNWNRNIIDDPIISAIEKGSQAGVGLAAALINDAKNYDNFVEITREGDSKYNEDLMSKLVNDTTKYAYDTSVAGATLLGIPYLAPIQEFVQPFFTKHKIALINELSYANRENPQKYATAIVNIYEARSKLSQKTERLTPVEEEALSQLNQFANQSQELAIRIRGESDVEKQIEQLNNFTKRISAITNILTEKGIELKPLRSSK